MEYKTEVLKIIKRHKALVNDMDSLYANGYISALNDLETEVKKLTIHGVSNQRELLTDPFSFIFFERGQITIVK